MKVKTTILIAVAWAMAAPAVRTLSAECCRVSGASRTANPQSSTMPLWVQMLYDVRREDQFVKATNIIAQAKAFGYTGVILASSSRLGMLHLWNEEQLERLRKVKRLCDESGLEIAVGMWSFG